MDEMSKITDSMSTDDDCEDDNNLMLSSVFPEQFKRKFNDVISSAQSGNSSLNTCDRGCSTSPCFAESNALISETTGKGGERKVFTVAESVKDIGGKDSKLAIALSSLNINTIEQLKHALPLAEVEHIDDTNADDLSDFSSSVSDEDVDDDDDDDDDDGEHDKKQNQVCFDDEMEMPSDWRGLWNWDANEHNKIVTATNSMIFDEAEVCEDDGDDGDDDDDDDGYEDDPDMGIDIDRHNKLIGINKNRKFDEVVSCTDDEDDGISDPLYGAASGSKSYGTLLPCADYKYNHDSDAEDELCHSGLTSGAEKHTRVHGFDRQPGLLTAFSRNGNFEWTYSDECGEIDVKSSHDTADHHSLDASCSSGAPSSRLMRSRAADVTFSGVHADDYSNFPKASETSACHISTIVSKRNQQVGRDHVSAGTDSKWSHLHHTRLSDTMDDNTCWSARPNFRYNAHDGLDSAGCSPKDDDEEYTDDDEQKDCQSSSACHDKKNHSAYIGTQTGANYHSRQSKLQDLSYSRQHATMTADGHSSYVDGADYPCYNLTRDADEAALVPRHPLNPRDEQLMRMMRRRQARRERETARTSKADAVPGYRGKDCSIDELINYIDSKPPPVPVKTNKHSNSSRKSRKRDTAAPTHPCDTDSNGESEFYNNHTGRNESMQTSCCDDKVANMVPEMRLTSHVIGKEKSTSARKKIKNKKSQKKSTSSLQNDSACNSDSKIFQKSQSHTSNKLHARPSSCHSDVDSEKLSSSSVLRADPVVVTDVKNYDNVLMNNGSVKCAAFSDSVDVSRTSITNVGSNKTIEIEGSKQPVVGKTAVNAVDNAVVLQTSSTDQNETCNNQLQSLAASSYMENTANNLAGALPADSSTYDCTLVSSDAVLKTCNQPLTVDHISLDDQLSHKGTDDEIDGHHCRNFVTGRSTPSSSISEARESLDYDSRSLADDNLSECDFADQSLDDRNFTVVTVKKKKRLHQSSGQASYHSPEVFRRTWVNSEVRRGIPLAVKSERRFDSASIKPPQPTLHSLSGQSCKAQLVRTETDVTDANGRSNFSAPVCGAECLQQVAHCAIASSGSSVRDQVDDYRSADIVTVDLSVDKLKNFTTASGTGVENNCVNVTKATADRLACSRVDCLTTVAAVHSYDSALPTNCKPYECLQNSTGTVKLTDMEMPVTKISSKPVSSRPACEPSVFLDTRRPHANVLNNASSHLGISFGFDCSTVTDKPEPSPGISHVFLSVVESSACGRPLDMMTASDVNLAFSITGTHVSPSFSQAVAPNEHMLPPAASILNGQLPEEFVSQPLSDIHTSVSCSSSVCIYDKLLGDGKQTDTSGCSQNFVNMYKVTSEDRHPPARQSWSNSRIHFDVHGAQLFLFKEFEQVMKKQHQGSKDVVFYCDLNNQ